jgi:hypothetical protein
MSTVNTGSAPTLSSSQTEVGYRPVAHSAVLSICIGILSLLAFATVYFWIVPVLGLVISIWSSVRLEKARREYAGQFLAKIAIFLSLISAVAAPSRYYTQWFIIWREASAFTDDFLDRVLANRIKDAFVLTLSPPVQAMLERKPEDQEELDKTLIQHGQRYRQFLSEQLRIFFAGKAAEAAVTKMGVTYYDYSRGTYSVAVRYRIELGTNAYDVVVLAQGTASTRREWRGRKWTVDQTRVEPVITE